jgi:cation:H+ antiporter
VGWLTSTWSLGLAVGAFVVAAGTIAIFGSRLAGVVDRLADRTGLGEAIAGAVLLGAVTSIAGLVVSAVAAAADNPSLAVSNSVGGIAAQTAFIVVADLFYRPANLEHAAASVTNIFNSLLMVVLLAIVVLGAAAPPAAFLGVHPVTPLLLLAYAYGVRISRQVKTDPMWQPEETPLLRRDEPEERSFGGSSAVAWAKFAGLAAAVAAAGYVLARSGLTVIATTGLSGTVVGTFFTSVASSVPELVTAVAAVRGGALTMAVGGIVGGNTFDVLFIAVADVIYREGSLYEAMVQADLFVLGWTMLLVGIVSAGLVRRQREGIGFEGYAVLALYAAGLVIVSGMS